MVIDFMRTWIPDQSCQRSGRRYAGVVQLTWGLVDNRPGWKCNPEDVYRKGRSRLYFLWKLVL